MKKVILMSIIALLALSMIAISPVMAVTKGYYWCTMSIDQVNPGKEWTTGGGKIYHAKDAHWSGTYAGTFGTGEYDAWYEHIALNQNTGEGTFSGKCLLTTPEGTMAGSFRGKITGHYPLTGTMVGTHGTGMFEGVQMMGDLTGTQITTHAELIGTGTIKWH